MGGIILLTDSYKVTHAHQYPEGTETVYSYFESRGGPWSTTFFGLQYCLLKYLVGPVVTKEGIEEAEPFLQAHFGVNYFNRAGWEHILNAHKGRLPVSIKAVPEGTTVPQSNVLITIENTDPKCYWLTNYLETLLVQICWYACSVASQSREMKKTILGYLKRTGDESLIDYKCHDFGFRGVSSVESSGIGGCAHLVNFLGTDTMSALLVARDFYKCPMAGHSIKASEHSTITSWGEDHELDAFRNMLRKTPKGILACVSDSFNIWRAITNYWGTELRDEILARDGTLVVRPDSGEPTLVVPKYLDLLGERFPVSVNAKGYKVLDPHIRLIQGDGIKFDTLGPILEAVRRAGWSADNLAFGSGGGLLQNLNRDTLKYAFKCSAITVNGEEREVYKSPITDTGKRSKRGRLKLILQPSSAHVNDFTTVSAGENMFRAYPDVLQEVFRDGEVLITQSLDEIRERAAIPSCEVPYIPD
jgi:nicotinamide phosphoribosyltransferase